MDETRPVRERRAGSTSCGSKRAAKRWCAGWRGSAEQELLERGAAALCRRVIGIRAGGVLRGVDHLADPGHALENAALDSLAQRDDGHAAALAAAAHLDVDHVVLHV